MELPVIGGKIRRTLNLVVRGKSTFYLHLDNVSVYHKPELEPISMQRFEKGNSRPRCQHTLPEAPVGCRQRTPLAAGHVDLEEEKAKQSLKRSG